MVFELWGASGSLGLTLPDSPAGYVLLLLYCVLLGFTISRLRPQFNQLRQQWQWIGLLAIAAFLTSQLLPLNLDFLPGIAPITLTLFAFFPLLLTAALFNPMAALLVGLAGGLGQSLGESHTLFDPFIFAFAGVIAAVLMQQNFNGRFYTILRFPAVSGIVAGITVAILTGFSTFVNAESGTTLLAALDGGLIAFRAHFWVCVVEGLVAGGLVLLLLTGIPQLRRQRALIPSPEATSLSRRLLHSYIGFAILLTVLATAVVFSLSLFISTRLVMNQMAHDAATVSASVPDFQAHLQSLLLQYSDSDSLLSSSTADSEKTLRDIFRSTPLYRRIVLVDADQEISAFFPTDADVVDLTELEATAVTEALTTSIPNIALAESTNDEHIVSFIVPVQDQTGQTSAVLVGRVPQLPLQDLIVGLQGTVGEGTGFIVNGGNQIIAHPDSEQLLTHWELAPSTKQVGVMGVEGMGTAVQIYNPLTNQHQLLYALASDGHEWQVVITTPYEVVLQLALSIGLPLMALLIAIMFIFYLNLAVIGRDITTPVTELAQAAKTVAAGGQWTPPVKSNRHDELGELTEAFSDMYQSRNQRISDLQLLLEVSLEVSSTIDLRRGLGAILRGALRGSGAVGARAVVVNPSGNQPLTFGEGPLANHLAPLDRILMNKLRQPKEVILTTPRQIRATLELPDNMNLPITAILAMALYSKNRFQGVIWLGFQQASNLDRTARNLLQTLAGQAAVLVDNAHLFATAEGGRRRLAAVLASTTDAVIVTDQTNRILLINRAMERIFELDGAGVKNRPVSNVVKNPDLVKALIGSDEKARNLEISLDDGRVFYANASTIISNDGHEFGRVAVLHDITHLKEIDAMKSDFVATVSHDLRSPLTFMRGYVTMLPMIGEVTDKQEEYIEKILGGIDQISQLVNDLLDLGRIEAGVDLRVENIHLHNLITDISSEHWQHAYAAGINLSVDLPDDLPNIQGDKALLRQALANYITNAIKYAPDSGPMLVQAKVSGDEVVIGVKDSGPGIPPEDHPRLFEKFYRVDRNDGGKVKGSGLGLALVRSIAERHGGRVWCSSQVGEGSTFYISLPLTLKS